MPAARRILGLTLLAIGICPLWTLPAWSDEPAAQPAPAATPPAADPAGEKPDPAKTESDQPAADKPEGEKPAGEKPKAAASPAADPADDEYYELYQIFADTLDQVERNYVKPVSRRELMEAAIDGVLEQARSLFQLHQPRRDRPLQEHGRKPVRRHRHPDHWPPIAIRYKSLSPLVGTPAYRAGLQAGDQILEIDGKTTDGLSHRRVRSPAARAKPARASR